MTQQINTPSKNLIDGKWNETGLIREAVNPSTGETIGHFVDAFPDLADVAVAAARRVFEQEGWSKDRALRARAINQLADKLAERQEEIALMLSREAGKLLAQTQWEVRLSVDWLRYSAATALFQTGGRAMETVPGTYFYSDPKPLGVVGVISPWNSPVILSVRAVGPALAAGCTVVLKVPAQTALTNTLFAEVIASADLIPAGAINVVTADGRKLAERLIESPEVDAISFTGSTRVGKEIGASAIRTLKRVGLELGGKAPLVVLDDADLNVVVPQLVMASIAMNGQFCCTGSRVLVQRGIADQLRERLVVALTEVRIGISDDPEAQLGPLINKESVERLHQVVNQAESYAKVLLRGGPVTEGPLAKGSFFRPSLIEVEPLDAFIVQNELFGPIQTFEIFEDEADGVRRANATDYGLAASVFSGDATRARRVGEKIRAGHIWLNCWGVMSEQFEQAGHKQSGVGSLCGPQAIHEFQEIKVYATVEERPDAA
ncbi:aldehyde dehydrogenase family protein [Rhizobium rhizogenes]|uniref:Aldehyde dehydrogenase n=1 Tax=Rhizobium rhizogenes TaxID=359 RepID=A0AA92BZU1_RHIRH|nr:aldehyde dehydrogenase family protein [Rhizobium rhizogenes]PVE50628.1 aldehyde dehydrogenase [Rhizobium rhizogenes]PVE62371.1 aldehyde dehydrogenase [Agrobacterium tumefaciens]PVE70554.1 aldehyde dehydrogenase [Sphingomonas sp. TPD3009]